MVLPKSLLHFDPVNDFNTNGLWSPAALMTAASQQRHIHGKCVQPFCRASVALRPLFTASMVTLD